MSQRESGFVRIFSGAPVAAPARAAPQFVELKNLARDRDKLTAEIDALARVRTTLSDRAASLQPNAGAYTPKSPAIRRTLNSLNEQLRSLKPDIDKLTKRLADLDKTILRKLDLVAPRRRQHEIARSYAPGLKIAERKVPMDVGTQLAHVIESLDPNSKLPFDPDFGK